MDRSSEVFKAQRPPKLLHVASEENFQDEVKQEIVPERKDPMEQGEPVVNCAARERNGLVLRAAMCAVWAGVKHALDSRTPESDDRGWEAKQNIGYSDLNVIRL